MSNPKFRLKFKSLTVEAESHFAVATAGALVGFALLLIAGSMLLH